MKIVLAKTYNCSECTNSYASISGLRGHLRKKHGITNAKGKEAIQYFDLVYFIVRFFFNHVHGGGSNDAVLSSEYLVYPGKCKCILHFPGIPLHAKTCCRPSISTVLSRLGQQNHTKHCVLYARLQIAVHVNMVNAPF